MRRRDFIKAVAGLGMTWSLAAHAQQTSKAKQVGILIGVADDLEGRARLAALQTGMQQLGWAEGQNVRFDVRFTAGEFDRAPGASTNP